MKFIRRAAMSAVPLVAASALLVGCSSSDEPAATDVETTAPADPVAEEAPEEPSPSASAGPVLKVGEKGTYDVIETDEYGENPAVATQMEVTVKEATYVTPAEVDTTNEPELGQYVRLTLTVKNVGTKPGDFSAYGLMKWENDDTAAQDATTLEGVGEGASLDVSYKPGQSVTGSMVLDVGAKGGTLTYWGGEGEGEAPVFSVTLPS
ncbi:DUF4352 domain-containing protein [Streptomyces niveus]|uniref:DUF4352 domain-containing protein n=1 Tax=Streptomyces niveus TaxID=193462 RepID=UPI0036572FEA